MFSSNGSQVSSSATYIEDVFSTYLYTGNGSTQTITNNIDLSTKGGMVWIKNRNGAEDNVLFDTNRGAGSTLYSNATAAADTNLNRLSAFNSNGFSIGNATRVNTNASTYASWTFRKQPKFFDVVTYTGNGVAGRTVAHNLGSVPGCMFVKCLDTTATDWYGYHRSLGATYRIILNSTSAASVSSLGWNNTEPTSTEFTVSANGNVNGSGKTYVAYLFAHDAGGFGLTGTDNVISCGSYTGNGLAAGPTITLGYEPQWILIKSASGAYDWYLHDASRGMSYTASNFLNPNASNAEAIAAGIVLPLATGFQIATTGAGRNTSGATYIYIAIRRGPMKVPTDATKVFKPTLGSSSTPGFLTGWPVDSVLSAYTPGDPGWPIWFDRLRGTNYQQTSSTVGEQTGGTVIQWDIQNGEGTSALTTSFVGECFRRAPNFFDEVCYTGTGVARTVTHNLGAIPELMIVRIAQSGQSGTWMVYDATNGNTKYSVLNSTAASTTGSTVWNNTSPTSSVFTVGTSANTNASGINIMAYLFATCPGVSKVGSYTGTGTTLQINCGFTGGARFVMIKRTDSTGGWYVWDTAQGIVSGNDPYFLVNSTAAQVTGTDYIDTYSAGFEISSTAPAAVNASGGSFIFLAIA